MYEAFYGLTAKPFALLPDPAFLYLGTRHRAALTYLEYGLLNQAPLTVITGDPGTGKTTLLNRILGQSAERFVVGAISNVQPVSGSLMPWILHAFGLERKGDPVDLFQELSAFLSRVHQRRLRAVLLVDEAQNLDEAMLEELRLLLNLNNGNRHVLQIILSGQPPLRRLLQRPDMSQFVQRVAVDYGLEPLGEEETRAYVNHRLRVAGATRRLFTSQACRAVFHVTGGVPRLINQVCETALVYGFAEQAAHVSAQLLLRAAGDRAQGGILPLGERCRTWVHSTEDEEAELREIADGGEKSGGEHPLLTREAAPEAVYEKGLACRKAGLFADAMSHFEQAAKSREFHFRAAVQKALCLHETGRTAEAVASLRALAGPGDLPAQEIASVRYLLGRMLETLDRPTDALAEYGHVQRLYPTYKDIAERLRRLRRNTAPPVRLGSRAGGWIAHALRGWHYLLGGLS